MSEPQNHEQGVELDLALFTRRLNSGLIVPEAAEETTAPIDIVDREPEQLIAPVPRPRPPAPAPQAAPPQPEPIEPDGEPAQDMAEEPSRNRPKAAAPAAKPAPAASRRTVRDALVDFLDRRRPDRADQSVDEDEPITAGAFVAVGLMTFFVAALSFALSFDMMYAAAQLYGWGKGLAALFPVIIDVGAIGGTFMGAISANRTYRRIGHQVLVVTLAASVLFNLVGHDVKGKATLLGASLPPNWGWTGTVAAVLIPALLAYFVHAFSKALKTFTDQKRAAAAAAAAEAEAERKRRADAAEAARREKQRQAEAAAEQRRREAAAEQRRLEREARHQEQLTQPSVHPEPKRIASARMLDADTAFAWSQAHGHPGPAAVRKHFADEGYEVPNALSTLRAWINTRRAEQHR
ncbi:hypothetical protein AB0F91_39910 [Amycolatopsis sp. NPDC023774]|uniref:hypothetical protein n=1 Tax=Amycolatopsis sp. NPDC023774 TaxID=3155015 RepID=UPI00340C3A39